MRTVKIEAQASSGVEENLRTFLASDVNGVIGLLQAPLALLLRKYFVLLICFETKSVLEFLDVPAHRQLPG
jgi:hypothetical protein